MTEGPALAEASGYDRTNCFRDEEAMNYPSLATVSDLPCADWQIGNNARHVERIPAKLIRFSIPDDHILHDVPISPSFLAVRVAELPAVGDAVGISGHAGALAR